MGKQTRGRSGSSTDPTVFEDFLTKSYARLEEDEREAQLRLQRREEEHLRRVVVEEIQRHVHPTRNNLVSAAQRNCCAARSSWLTRLAAVIE